MSPISKDVYLTNHRTPENSTTELAAAQVRRGLLSNKYPPSPSPFSHQNDELLLVLMERARHQDFFKARKYSYLIEEDGNLSQDFYLVTNTDGFDEVVKSGRLSILWSEYLIGAYKRKRLHIGPLLNVTVSVEGIHFKEYVEQVGKSVVKGTTPLAVTCIQLAQMMEQSFSIQTPADMPLTAELPSSALNNE